MNNTKGYYPKDEIIQKAKVQSFGNKFFETLGARYFWMVYPEFPNHEPYVLDALLGDETRSLSIAKYLWEAILVCHYPTKGKDIRIFDVEDVAEIPSDYDVMEDGSYIIGLSNADEAVYMKIYKKQ